MNQPKISLALQQILVSGDHEKADAPISDAALENFLMTVGDETFSFFPDYPSLPKTKYLLRNYENLRPELKIKFQGSMIRLWNLAEPAPEKEIMPEQPAAEVVSPPLERTAIIASEQPSAPLCGFGTTRASGIPRKQDAFDRFLDVIARLVRAFAFS